MIASLSHNYIERFVLERGHTANRRSSDYGYDLFVETFDGDGYVENGEIRIQLKATDHLGTLKHRDSLALDIDVGHYEQWVNEMMPVFLILFDAQARRAYWIQVQHYFDANPAWRPKKGAKTIRVHIPLENEFTEDTVDYMRARKAEILVEDRRRRRAHG